MTSISYRKSISGALITISAALIHGDYFLTAMGLGLCIFVLIDFIEKIGKTIPILELMLLLACLQWMVGPYFEYRSQYHHYRYHMYVLEERYMELVVPSLCLFALMIYYWSPKINCTLILERIQTLRISDMFPSILIAIGFLSVLFVRATGVLDFVFYLLTGVKYVSVLYFFYKKSLYKWWAFSLVFSYLLIESIRHGMFHDLLLWSVLVSIFIVPLYKISFSTKVIFLISGFVMVFTLQTIKAGFRDIVWSNNFQGNKIDLFIEVFSTKLNDLFVSNETDTNQNDRTTANANNRINQGWIISKIMSNIPARNPYLKGETVKEAVYSSLVPRFLVESKIAGGGGKLSFEKLTGTHLESGTSMGVGILGEVYGNYGVTGTYIFMFLWGIFVSTVLKFIWDKSALLHSLPLWLPLIFFQVVKAETDLFTVLNHLVKATIFVFGFIFIIKQFFKIRL